MVSYFYKSYLWHYYLIATQLLFIRETRRVVEDSDDEDEDRKGKLSLKRGLGSEARAALAANVDADVQLLTPLEQQRARFKQKKRLQGSREGAVS